MSLIFPTFGWCFFKRGGIGHHGKVHFLAKNNWISLCGLYKVRREEEKYINFRKKTEFSERKICKSCENNLWIDDK